MNFQTNSAFAKNGTRIPLTRAPDPKVTTETVEIHPKPAWQETQAGSPGGPGRNDDSLINRDNVSVNPDARDLCFEVFTQTEKCFTVATESEACFTLTKYSQSDPNYPIPDGQPVTQVQMDLAEYGVHLIIETAVEAFFFYVYAQTQQKDADGNVTYRNALIKFQYTIGIDGGIGKIDGIDSILYFDDVPLVLDAVIHLASTAPGSNSDIVMILYGRKYDISSINLSIVSVIEFDQASEGSWGLIPQSIYRGNGEFYRAMYEDGQIFYKSCGNGQVTGSCRRYFGSVRYVEASGAISRETTYDFYATQTPQLNCCDSNSPQGEFFANKYPVLCKTVSGGWSIFSGDNTPDGVSLESDKKITHEYTLHESGQVEPTTSTQVPDLDATRYIKFHDDGALYILNSTNIGWIDEHANDKTVLVGNSVQCAAKADRGVVYAEYVAGEYSILKFAPMP